jgi:lysine-N-methylase
VKDRPLRSLPVLQNWDCHQCGNCCTDYHVPVSEAEQQRIAGQGWEQLPEYQGKPIFVRHSPWWRFWRKKYRLRTHDDRCIFLDEKGLCKIHDKFGLLAKPFACRLYPYILVPVGDQWRISMRFACPSATANKGRPLAQQRQEITAYASEMEKWDDSTIQAADASEGQTARSLKLVRDPKLRGGTTTSWAELDTFVKAMVAVVQDKQDAFPRRILRIISLIRLCRQAKFEKVTGKKLQEFLQLVSAGTAAEVPRDLAKVPPPRWIGRILFRTTLAVFLRKDSGVRRGVAARSRLGLMAAMMRMAFGRGQLPELQKGLPALDFAGFEKETLGNWEPASVELLTRYYGVKLDSCQFFGPSCYDLNFWDGLLFLMLTFPCICWLARGYLRLGQTAALQKAINIVDENYAYNPLLGHARQKLTTRILFAQGELERLVARYGK